MITLDKTKYYYLDNLTMRQLQEVADAILADPKSFEIWDKGDKKAFNTLKGCLNTKRLLFYRYEGNHRFWVYHPKEFKVNSGDFTNAKGLFKVEDITFKNKKVCII